MAQKIILPDSKRFTARSKECTRSLLVNFVSRVAEMGDMKTAQHLLTLSSEEWNAFVVALLEQSRAIVFEQQRFEKEVRLTELRIQRGLTRDALVTRLRAGDRGLRIEALNLWHIENSHKSRLEAPESWRSALCSFFKTDWDSLCEPISNK